MTLAKQVNTAAALSASDRRALRIWLWTGAFLTLSILVVGGITRLTQSGLSIVEWAPLVGVVPPLNEAQWEEAFAAYRQYPEYQQLRPTMTLAEYKTIFFWEYLHRLIARGIGLVFIVPFAVFWARGLLSGRLKRRLLFLFALGAMQGVMGWIMVASGLADQPYVDHLRLAAHLALAFLIFGTCLWIAADLGPRRKDPEHHASRWKAPTLGVVLLGGLLGIQIVYGAFVAGLDAGYAFNTFPRMAGGFFPPEPFRLEPALRNLTDNHATVQWIHRWLAFVLIGTSLALVFREHRPGADRVSARWSVAMIGLLAVQAALGIATLVLFVPISLAVIHQAVALLAFGAWTLWWHRVASWRRDGAEPAS